MSNISNTFRPRAAATAAAAAAAAEEAPYIPNSPPYTPTSDVAKSAPHKPSPGLEQLYFTQYPWLRSVAGAYDKTGLPGALAAFDAALVADTTLAAKPSTFIVASEVLHAVGAPKDVCADLLFNVLETKLPDAQVCRVLAYHLLSYECFDAAVLLLELVRDTLAPAEPHSFCDLAFARFHKLRHASSTTEISEIATSADLVKTEMSKVVADLTTVLTGIEWASRFAEIEWPVLILLSWAAAWAEHKLATWQQPTIANTPNATPSSSSSTTVWPEEKLPADKYRLGGSGGPSLDLFVWLGWDTDHTDVDLHVQEPTGEEVYYSHNRSDSTGAHVSRDFTDGYGPEVYTLPNAPKGSYGVETNYYASHQDSTATGSTSAVVWTIERMGRFGEEKVAFKSVRLTKHKQRQRVLTVDVA